MLCHPIRGKGWSGAEQRRDETGYYIPFTVVYIEMYICMYVCMYVCMMVYMHDYDDFNEEILETR